MAPRYTGPVAGLDEAPDGADDQLDEHATDDDRAWRAIVQRLLRLPKKKRVEFIDTLTAEQLEAMTYCWRAWARPEQLAPPGDWMIWLAKAGRGWGKSKTGAEWVRDEVKGGRARIIHLVGGTLADVRDVMVKGPAGILACTPPGERPVFIESRRRLVWPNGAYALCFTSVEYELLRGPQCDLCWGDEIGRWQYPDETISNIEFGLRLTGPKGHRPRALFTTTPRPIKAVRELMARDDVIVTHGTTFDNIANLSAPAVAMMLKKNKGTRLGRQELFGEMLDDIVGANWTRADIDAAHALGRRMNRRNAERVVIAVDPSASAPVERRKKKSDDDGLAECGIVACARFPAGLYHEDDSTFGVLEDATVKTGPRQWAKRVIGRYRYWGASAVVAEGNNGGETVRALIHALDPNVNVIIVHASESKLARAEPVAGVYGQSRVGHLAMFPELEDQQCTFTAAKNDKSPDRHDALVWGITELMDDESVTLVDVDETADFGDEQHWSTYAG